MTEKMSKEDKEKIEVFPSEYLKNTQLFEEYFDGPLGISEELKNSIF